MLKLLPMCIVLFMLICTYLHVLCLSYLFTCFMCFGVFWACKNLCLFVLICMFCAFYAYLHVLWVLRFFELVKSFCKRKKKKKKKKKKKEIYLKKKKKRNCIEKKKKNCLDNLNYYTACQSSKINQITWSCT